MCAAVWIIGFPFQVREANYQSEEIVDALWDQFAAKHGDWASDHDAVEQAASRVMRQWQANGVRNLDRQMLRDPDAFFDAILDEMSYSPGPSSSDYTHRTAVFGGAASPGARRVGKSDGPFAYDDDGETSAEGSSLVDLNTKWLKENGYY